MIETRSTLAKQLDREPRAIAGKTPPADLAAEAAVVCACLSQGDSEAERMAVPMVREMLQPSDFFGDSNKLVMDAIFALHDLGMATDVITVKHRLEELEQMRRVGALYLGELLDATPAVANVMDHAHIVSRMARVRRLIQACQTFAAHGYSVGSGGAAEFANTVATKIFALTQESSSSRTVRLADELDRFDAQIKATDHNVALRGLPTRFADLDLKTRMRLGDLTLLGGRPGMGKTSLALNIAANVAATPPGDIGEDSKSGVAVFSLEMPKEQLAARFACSAAGVSVYATLNEPDKLSAHDHASLGAATAYLKALPIWIDDTPAISLASLRAKIQLIAHEAAQNGTPLRLVIIDYLQLMAGTRGMDRHAQIGEISRGLKQIAKEISVHVMALVQLNRGVESRAPPIPSLTDLRDSGELEQDADCVTFVYRHDYYEAKGKVDPDPSMAGLATIIIEKQRNGPTGTVMLRFIGTSTTFQSLANGEQPGENCNQ